MQVIESEISGVGKFLMEENIIQLGIAFIISIQLNQVTSSLIDDILSPFLLLQFGADKTQSMKDLYIEIYSVRINYGTFLLALMKFLLLVIILYNVVLIMAKYQLIDNNKVKPLVGK